jgi:hypothetical protein
MTSALAFVLSIPAVLMAVVSVVALRRLSLPSSRPTEDERALRDREKVPVAAGFDIPKRAA